MLPAVAGLVVVLAGVVGFRLTPDSYLYAGGELFPYPLPLPSVGGMIGRVGGMPLLIAVSGLAAWGCLELLPGTRARLGFLAAGGFWLLFPGVDGLGVLMVALMASRPLRGGIWWASAGIVHPVAGIAAAPYLLRRWWSVPACFVVVAGVIVLFTATDPSVAHLAYLSRYLLPCFYLAFLEQRRPDRLLARRQTPGTRFVDECGGGSS